MSENSANEHTTANASQCPATTDDASRTPEAIRFKAHPHRDDSGWMIEPAHSRRDWMESTLGKAALRCLPLSMANQAGWVVKLPMTFKAKWTQRKAGQKYTEISFPSKDDERYRPNVATNFGSGIVTIVLPWIFRTSPGIGLWVHAPSNMPRPDLYPLEGLVETDWSPYPFTMNWKIMRPKVEVWFRKGEPICMLTPFPLDMLEHVEPRFVPLQNDLKLAEHARQANERREEERRLRRTVTEGKFELNYMRGYCPDGEQAPSHRSNFKLKEFE